MASANSSSSSSSSSSSASVPPRSLAPAMALTGALAVTLLNAARHRPLFFQPWLHAAAALAGAAGGARLAALYDDTADVLNRQSASFASLPSWAYAQLSPEDLGAWWRWWRRRRGAARARPRRARRKARRGRRAARTGGATMIRPGSQNPI